MTSSPLFPLLLFLCGGVFLGVNSLTITTPQGLVNFANDVNSGSSYSGETVYLSSDLDFSSALSSSFAPIGNSSTCPFKGTFDGQGYVIKNLVMSLPQQFVGLFGYSNEAIIKNIVMDVTCSVVNSYSGSFSGSTINVGGINGCCNSCTIKNVVSMTSISYNSLIDYFYSGGIVGRLLSFSTVNNCANYNSIKYYGTVTKALIIGGIVGFCDEENKLKNIQNCVNYGSLILYGTTEKLVVGGIVGDSYYAEINNCLSAGTIGKYGIASVNYMGSIIGNISDSYTNIKYCYFTSNVRISNLYGNGKLLTPTETPSYSVNASTAISNLDTQAVSNGWNKWLSNPNNIPVTFKINNNVGFSLSSHAIILPRLIENGTNLFKGWFTDSSYSNFSSPDEVSSETTLYGLYGIIVYVSFNGNESNISHKVKYVKYGDKYGTLPTMEKEGYSFVGWFTEGDGNRKKSQTILLLRLLMTICFTHTGPSITTPSHSSSITARVMK